MITILSLLFISTCTINSYRLHHFFVFWTWFGYKSLYLVMIHFGIGFKYYYFVYDLSAATFPLYLSEAYKGE